MLGPISSGYAGKPVTLFFAGLTVLIFITVFLGRKTSQVVDGRSNWKRLALIGIVCAYLLGMALWDIWRHR